MKPPDLSSMSSTPLILMADAPPAYGTMLGPEGNRIAELADIDADLLCAAFELQYLLDRRPVGGAIIPTNVTEHICQHMARSLKGRHVLFYGRALPLHFGFSPTRPLAWHSAVPEGNDEPLFAFAVVPDFDIEADPVWAPWWNEADHVRQAEDFLRKYTHPLARSADDECYRA